MFPGGSLYEHISATAKPQGSREFPTRIWGTSRKNSGNFPQESGLVLAEKKELLGGFLKRKIVAE